MIKNVIFDMGNVLLRFDRDYFLDAVGVQGADRKLLLNNVYLSLLLLAAWAVLFYFTMIDEIGRASCRERV